MLMAGPTLVLAAALAADGATPAPPATAAADGGGPGVRLSWVRGEGAGSCPDANAIEAEVVGRLGSNPFARQPTQFIEAMVTQRPDGHQVNIAMRAADGKLLGNRALTSTAPDCRSVATAAALTIAIMIDPDVLARAPAVVPSAPPAPPPEPTPPPPEPAPSFPPGRVTALVGAGWGLLPGVAPGAGLAATADVSRRAALGSVHRVLPRTADGGARRRLRLWPRVRSAGGLLRGHPPHGARALGAVRRGDGGRAACRRFLGGTDRSGATLDVRDRRADTRHRPSVGCGGPGNRCGSDPTPTPPGVFRCRTPRWDGHCLHSAGIGIYRVDGRRAPVAIRKTTT